MGLARVPRPESRPWSWIHEKLGVFLRTTASRSVWSQLGEKLAVKEKLGMMKECEGKRGILEYWIAFCFSS